jgi:hypothetical protein
MCELLYSVVFYNSRNSLSIFYRTNTERRLQNCYTPPATFTNLSVQTQMKNRAEITVTNCDDSSSETVRNEQETKLYEPLV